MMVYLGPQFVQLINGYLYLLSFLSKSSFKHSSHIAISGDMKLKPLSFLLSRITKSLKSSKSKILFSIFSIFDKGGVSFFILSIK